MTTSFLERDPTILASFATDFGHLVAGTPKAVARPGTVEDVAAVLQLARTEHITVTPWGQGLSQGGQSLSENGFALDLSGLAKVEEPDERTLTVRCEGGARWRAVVERCLRKRLLPRVLAANLDLTVGGVLSVGGVGASSHRAGLVASNVAALEVVTGAGDVRWARVAGPPDEAELAGAVLGGVGRFAVITRAEIELRRCASMVRTFYLLYDSPDRWLTDQAGLCASQRPPDGMEAFACVAGQGLRNDPRGRRPFGLWFYGLQLSYEYEPDDVKQVVPEAVLAGLHPYRFVHMEDNGIAAFQDRHRPRFEAMRALGTWNEPHPWVEAFLSLEAAGAILPGLLADLPLSLGDGHRLMFVAGDHLPFAVAVPEARPLVVFAMVPVGLPPALRQTHLEALGSAHERLVRAGGKRYLAGWLDSMTADGGAAWRTHFGPKFEAWRAAKARFDPDGVLSSTLFGKADSEAVDSGARGPF